MNGGEPVCAGWHAQARAADGTPKFETPEERSLRDSQNIDAEFARHYAWRANVNGWQAMPADWFWPLCGDTKIQRVTDHPHPDIIWNVETFSPISTGHNDITGDALTSFLRQLYLDVLDPPVQTPTR